MADFVIGACHGYDFAQLRPFVLSLNRSGFRGRLILLIDNMTPETVRALTDHGVECVCVRWRFRASRYQRRLYQVVSAVLRGLPARLRPLGVFRWTTVFMMARFAEYRRLLRGNFAPTDRVLLTDVRDVVFQGDPFAEAQEGLHVCMEAITIGRCRYNSSWIRAQFGEQTARHFAECQVTCSGTVIGDVESIRRYLDCFIDCLLLQPSPFGPASFDQGIHNYLLHSGALEPVVRHQPDDWVGTLGYVKPADIRVNQLGEIVDKEDRPIPILHQFDRHPDIARRIDARWGAGSHTARKCDGSDHL